MATSHSYAKCLKSTFEIVIIYAGYFSFLCKMLEKDLCNSYCICWLLLILMQNAWKGFFIIYAFCIRMRSRQHIQKIFHKYFSKCLKRTFEIVIAYAGYFSFLCKMLEKYLWNSYYICWLLLILMQNARKGLVK